MSSRGAATRQKILDAAQQLILEHGYSQASVDRVLERTGLTKGAFFYHFRNKVELTKALIDRYAADEAGILGEAVRRGESLARDPLQQFHEAAGEMRVPRMAVHDVGRAERAAHHDVLQQRREELRVTRILRR